MTSASDPPTRKQLSHERIVEAAARAIRRGGYHGVGVADIMKEAGLTHGGFYAHFASRDAMLVEAMQHASRDSSSTMKARIAERVARGEGRFAALVHVYLHDDELAGAEHGCIVAALASEMARQDDAVRDEARRRVTTLIDAVRRALPEGKDGDAAEVATATMVGAMQLARTLGGRPGKALLERTRKALIARYEPVAGHSG
jgi:AcrR family transcriptional regulator